ncbi:hypothetical protein [Nocardiopsis halotolerans]|uniref:hypothetical protein n=1 Tax=Nocardiopsis halotolerans TaxID=124252 RepID=UPI001F4CA33D|nr:hypothetical protein [Nocardiopsis halotolerans]
MSHDACPHPARIPGYHHDGSLNWRPELLDERLFWVVHLYPGAQGEGERWLFGPDRTWDDYVRFQRRVWDRAELPAFAVPLANGHCLYVVYGIDDGDAGVVYLLHHPGWEEADVIAVSAGNGMVPGLSWPELVAAVDNGPPGAEHSDPHTRLLLLLPAWADDSVPQGAVRRLAAALSARVGVESPEPLAAAILGRQGESGPVHWTTTGTGVRTNDGRYSFRNPGTSSALTGDSLARVSAALAP